VGLNGLIHRPAQYRRSLPGQPPGQALAVRRPDGDVQPGEPDRFAAGREPVCPPSQQVSANAVTGPTPYSRAARTFAPVRCRAAASTCLRSASMRASRAASMSTAVATCTCRSYCSATAKCRAPRSLALRARPSSDLPAARGCRCPALHRAANTGHGLVPYLRSRRSPPRDAVDGLLSRGTGSTVGGRSPERNRHQTLEPGPVGTLLPPAQQPWVPPPSVPWRFSRSPPRVRMG
jgi:hypothetical protein